MKVDTDRVAEKFLHDGVLFICPEGFKERVCLIELLEKEGFFCGGENGSSRTSIIKSKYPLMVSLKEKSISCMGNTTTAAAAVSSGLVMSSREFYLLYSVHSILEDIEGDKKDEKKAEYYRSCDVYSPQMSYEEYIVHVFRCLVISDWNYSPEESTELIRNNSVFIRDSYEHKCTVMDTTTDIGYFCG